LRRDDEVDTAERGDADPLLAVTDVPSLLWPSSPLPAALGALLRLRPKPLKACGRVWVLRRLLVLDSRRLSLGTMTGPAEMHSFMACIQSWWNIRIRIIIIYNINI
jgi:hypothetical protein